MSLEALRWAVRAARTAGGSVDAVTAWKYPAGAGGFGWSPGSVFAVSAHCVHHAPCPVLVIRGRHVTEPRAERRLIVVPGVALSNQEDALVPRTWIALLRGRVRAALAATSGVETPDDVAAYLLAGADVAMTASALLRHGPDHATVLLEGLSSWMAAKGFHRIDDLRGMLAVPADADEATYERAGYVAALRAANASAYSP